MSTTKTVKHVHRGHEIRRAVRLGVGVYRTESSWYYADTGQDVKDDPLRACGSCGLESTPEGHDGCLGALPGVRNACCGHGDPAHAYVQLEEVEGVGGRAEHRCVRGEDALALAAELGANFGKKTC